MPFNMLHKVAAALAGAAMLVFAGSAMAAEAPKGKPITIGFSMAQTGGLAANGKMALLAMQIWAADTNAKGGLLGRPVKLVYYDDQSNPPLVPGIYTKLIEVDKVDFVVGGYATNMTAPAIPIAMQHNKLLIGLFALDANAEFKYPKYFSMLPTGPHSRAALTEGYFALIKEFKDQLGLKTIALVADDGEATLNALDGARQNLKGLGLKVVYDHTYPPTTTDFTPIVRAIQATRPDVVFIASYPPDSVGMIRAMHEIGLKTKICCGVMVGPQTTSVKMQLGSMLNGLITYDFWLPAPTLQFPGVMDMLKRYQAKAASAGIDPLGYYLAPWAYADLQVLGEAIAGANSIDQDKVAHYMHTHTFKTVVGNVSFGPLGEWTTSRILTVQFQNVKGSSADDFRGAKSEVVLYPTKYKSGKAELPYSSIKH